MGKAKDVKDFSRNVHIYIYIYILYKDFLLLNLRELPSMKC